MVGVSCSGCGVPSTMQASLEVVGRSTSSTVFHVSEHRYLFGMLLLHLIQQTWLPRKKRMVSARRKLHRQACVNIRIVAGKEYVCVFCLTRWRYYSETNTTLSRITCCISFCELISQLLCHDLYRSFSPVLHFDLFLLRFLPWKCLCFFLIQRHIVPQNYLQATDFQW